MGWSKILTDLQEVREAGVRGKQCSCPGSFLWNESLSTAADRALTITETGCPSSKSLSLLLSKVGTKNHPERAKSANGTGGGQSLAMTQKAIGFSEGVELCPLSQPLRPLLVESHHDEMTVTAFGALSHG